MISCSPTLVIVGRRIFYIFFLGIPVFLAYTGVMGLITLKEYTAASTSTVFQSVYMILFATLLFVFEAIQICPCEAVDNVIKRNFGFFYGVFGKAFYTLMIGIFAYGLESPRQLAIACAVVVAAFGPFCILVHVMFPNFFEKKEKFVL